MRPAQTLAVVATFSAMIVGSDFALTYLPNVKLLDSLVFVAAFVFGFRVGAYVGILSELTWSFVSPVGFAGYITPFLVAGEVMYAVAGWGAARVWGRDERETSRAMYFGASLVICAFLWDLETNFATALMFWPNVNALTVLASEVQGIPFALLHEVSDFALGVLFVPLAIQNIPRIFTRYRVATPANGGFQQ